MLNFIVNNPVKSFLILMSLIVLLLVTGNSYSQSRAETRAANLDVLCVDERTLEVLVSSEYNEVPMLTLTSTRTIKGKDVTLPTVLFVNPETRSWTLVEQWGKNLYCIISLGVDATPYSSRQSKYF
jgi:hypothetical protein